MSFASQIHDLGGSGELTRMLHALEESGSLPHESIEEYYRGGDFAFDDYLDLDVRIFYVYCN